MARVAISSLGIGLLEYKRIFISRPCIRWSSCKTCPMDNICLESRLFASSAINDVNNKAKIFNEGVVSGKFSD